ncbi:MAG: EAL domain-containing protein [Methylovirgula sp.]|jgi:diguanylate cyclase (GGDEF)-like protein
MNRRFSRYGIWRSALDVKDAALDDGLYQHLVASLFTSQASLNSANVMGMLIIVAAYGLTKQNVFLLLLSLVVVVGATRALLFRSYAQRKGTLNTRQAFAYYDTMFFILSTCFSVIIGITCYQLIQEPPATGTHAIAAGVGVGYAMGFVARNAGRPRLVIMQVVTTLLPMIIGYALMQSTFGSAAAILLCGTIIAASSVTLSLHENLIAVYNANKATRQLALFDKLTGLSNRYTFVDQVAETIAEAPGKKFAVLYLDVDRFKDINDTLGHTAGDAVIVEVARRLKETTRGNDLIARFGGDEFLIKIADSEPRELERIVQRMVRALARPINIEGNALTPSASIGIATFPDNGNAAEEVIKNADISLYEAKRSGGNTYRMFDPEMEQELQIRRTLQNEMQVAVRRHEFLLHYQPIYELGSKEVVSVEALLRWNHPTRGLLGPNTFIPIAEQTMSIIEIGEQVIETACRTAMTLPDHVSIAVNLSAVQFRQPERLISNVQAVLLRTGLRADRLNLEITESLLLADTVPIKTTLETLKGLGIKLVLDDFGTGYSSLSYIQDFPFSKIKIDRKFTASLSVNAASPSIIRAITQIAKDLSLEIVVEGIETKEQEAFIRMLGPTQGQGFLYSKPITRSELAAQFEFKNAGGRRDHLAS